MEIKPLTRKEAIGIVKDLRKKAYSDPVYVKEMERFNKKLKEKKSASRAYLWSDMPLHTADFLIKRFKLKEGELCGK